MTNTPDINNIWRGVFRLRSVPVLSGVVANIFSSIVVLTADDNFGFVPLLHSVCDMYVP
jgi:hypothetical protein